MEKKLTLAFDSEEFLRLSIEPYFQHQFAELLNQKKNEETKALLEKNIVERCSNVQTYLNNNMSFIKKNGNIDCNGTVIDILTRYFVIDIKSLNKRETVEASNEAEKRYSFKDLCLQLVSKICVYKYQIMFRFSILYFHFESSQEKREERKTLEKDMTKDLDKLINLFNVKLFSEDDESNPDTFYKELAETFTREITNIDFLNCILKILEECQVSKSITEIFETQIQKTTAAALNNTASKQQEKETQQQQQEELKKVQNLPVPQQREAQPIKVNLNKKIAPSPKDMNLPDLKTLSQNKSQDLSAIPFTKLETLKSVPTTKQERQAMTTTFKDTKLGNIWSRKESTSQNSSQVELLNSQFKLKLASKVSMQENSRTSEDFMSINLVEKNRELNDRMRHRSFYSSFNKTTQITSKKRKKEKETEFPKELENKLKKTKLTTETNAANFKPASQPINKISCEGIQLFEKFKQKETPTVNASQQSSTKIAEKMIVPEKKEDNNHLKVPVINSIFDTWGFGDVIAVNTPIKDALSEENSIHYGSCSNSRRSLEYH